MNQSFHQSEDPILTVPQVPRYLKVSEAKTCRLLSKKEIPLKRLAGMLGFARQIFKYGWKNKSHGSISVYCQNTRNLLSN